MTRSQTTSPKPCRPSPAPAGCASSAACARARARSTSSPAPRASRPRRPRTSCAAALSGAGHAGAQRPRAGVRASRRARGRAQAGGWPTATSRAPRGRHVAQLGCRAMVPSTRSHPQQVLPGRRRDPARLARTSGRRHLAELAEVRDRTGDSGRRLEAVLEPYALLAHRGHGAELAGPLYRGHHVAGAQQKVRELFLRSAAGRGGGRRDLGRRLARGAASSCLHALAAAGSLRSKAAVRRLVGVVLAGAQRFP